MTVRYHQRRDILVPDYQCVGETSKQRPAAACESPATASTTRSSQLLLDTVTPLALEVALTVQAELEARAEEADQLRRSTRRTRPPTRRARPPPLPRRRPRQPARRRHPRGRLERHAARSSRHAQDEYERQTAAANAALNEQRKAQIRQLAADFPALWTDPATPARERKRIARLLIEDVTLNKTDQIHLHVRFRGGQTTSLTIPIPRRRLGSPPDRPRHARAARPPARRSHRRRDRRATQRHRPPLRARPNRSPDGSCSTSAAIRHLPSHADRLRARGLLTLNETAERLGVHTKHDQGLAPRRPAQSHKANDKNERLYDPPDPGDPRLVKRLGWRLDKREPTPTDPRGAL